MKKVVQWTADEVSHWLSEEGMQEYGEALCHTDGPALLRLTEVDFLTPPLSLVSSDNGGQLLERLETMRIEHHIQAHKNGHSNGHIVGMGNGTSKLQRYNSDWFHKYRLSLILD